MEAQGTPFAHLILFLKSGKRKLGTRNRLIPYHKREEIRGSEMLTKELLLSHKDELNCLLGQVGKDDIDSGMTAQPITRFFGL